MWNPKDFDIKANSEAGEWFQLVDGEGQPLCIEVDGKEIKSRVKVIGPKTKTGMKLKAEAERLTRDHQAKIAKLEKKGQQYEPTDEEIEASDRRDIDTIKALVVDWEGIPNEAQDGQAKCTDKEKERVFSVDFFRSQIITNHINPLNFIKKS